MITSIRGQKELRQQVLEADLCTDCGACVNLCPYCASYKDRTVMIDPCDRPEGRCYAFCPRTPTDLTGLRQNLGAARDWNHELGAFQGLLLTRAVDPDIRRSAQHGGTVTALITLAMAEGLIDGAVLSEEGQDFLPRGVLVRGISEVKGRARSKFVVSPTLAAFNQAVKSNPGKLAVVATPCQALALAKMRLHPLPGRDSHIDRLRLVIGLFCGWALSWQRLKGLLQGKIGGNSITGLDIPPSKYHCLEVRTRKGKVEISLDEVLPAVRKACTYCWDLTAEFGDISVGSARLPEGWEVARGWNQLIVRTPRGRELLELARSRGVLELREAPPGNLEKLKTASLNKKRAAVKNLQAKSGSLKDLLYLDSEDPLWESLLE